MISDDKRKPVSIYAIGNLISPLAWPEFSDSSAASLNPDDLKDREEIFSEWIAPHYSRYDSASQEVVRQSLEFFLISNPDHLSELWPSLHLELRPPCDALSFFVALYEHLFGLWRPEEIDVQKYEVKPGTGLANSLAFRSQ